MIELKKNIKNGRMLKSSGSWLYCDSCQNTVGYLCYTTFQSFQFEFHCKCGVSGFFHLEYETEENIIDSPAKLEKKRNRLRCPNDDSPLFSTVDKNLRSFSYAVCCNQCYSCFKENAEIHG